MIGFMSDAGMVRPYDAPQLLFERIAPAKVPGGWRVVEDFEAPKRLNFTFEGNAFVRRGVPSIHGKLPAIGPIGGGRFLSSAGGARGLRGTGEATSPLISLPAKGGSMHLLAGVTGKGKNCVLAIMDESGTRLELPVPRLQWGLAPVKWEIEPTWAGRHVYLVISDADPEAAIFVDEVYLQSAD